MPTIPDIPPRPRPVTTRRRLPIPNGWPLALLAVALVAALWRVAGPDAQPAGVPGRTGDLVARTHADARVEVPREWVALDRGPDHVTWGEPDRAHTVTLASIESSTLPLPGIVAATVARTTDELPGVRSSTSPRAIDLEDAPRGDGAMLASFRVRGDDEPLEVVQVWRRDTRAGRDVLATWTSADGRWPVEPRDAIPSAAPAR